ncbi:MAG: hypothetical protein AABY22_30850 [Nanoarchaeota archaeon]
MKHSYIQTKYPKLFCPECGYHLKISNLNKKLWCKPCFKYVKEESLMDKFLKGVV